MMSESPTKRKEIPYSEFMAYVDGIYQVQKNGKQFNGRLVSETDDALIFKNMETKEKISIAKEPGYQNRIREKIKVTEVTFKGTKKIDGKYIQNGTETKGQVVHFTTFLPMSDPFLLKNLEGKGIRVVAESGEGERGFWGSIYSFLPWILLIGLVWFLFFRQVQSSNNSAFTFVKSKAKLYKTGGKKVTFNDVAGVEEAKEELKEVVDFLKEPQKFLKMQARIPKGVLLIGPPGTGKTLLARAVAGEANRPFYSISGSEFVEMFVGVGASRVRDLFENAKKETPCIVFIDELDAVGRQRGAGLGGGNDEREQTLNQILVEMDGFENQETVIVMAATNRPDILDPALLRPGRFDRQVVVDKADIKGREEILKIHVRNKPVADNVNLKKLAQGTPGFSGADLENMVNEAALIAARRDKEIIEMEDFEDARDKILMGPERKSRVMTGEEQTNTAYHEAGHALVSHYLPESDPLHKITIIPRGRALGLTQHLPESDRFSYTKNRLLTEIVILLGGRVAEEYRFGKENITTGAANDLKRASEIARSIVCQWGMSEKMGPLTYGKEDTPIFIGKEMGRYKDYSEETAREIEQEVKKIIEEQYGNAKKLINDHENKLELLVKELLERETLQATEIEKLLGPKPKKA
jgi:cell division protease FtsH